MNKLPLRLLSIGLSASILWTSGASQAAAGMAAPVLTLETRFAPPTSLGRITDLHDAGVHQNVVVLLQDLHAHYGVQKNIAKILDVLSTRLKKAGANLPFALAVEGASGPIDSSEIAQYPDKRLKQQASDYLMRQGEMSGAEYFVVMRGLSHALTGVEEGRYYEAHRDLFRKTLSDRTRLVRALQDIQTDIQPLRTTTYSKIVRELQAQSDALHQGKIGIEEYVGSLADRADEFQLPLTAGYPVLARFLRNPSVRHEVELDAVYHEAAELTFRLKLANSASKAEKDLIQVERDLDLLLRVADLQATELEVRDFAPRLNQFVALAKTLTKSSSLDDLRRLISSSVDYYVMALVRNKPMVENTLKLVDTETRRHEDTEKTTNSKPLPITESPRPPVAVLVAGGFHTAEITQMLREKKTSYVVITPAVNQISKADHDLYIKRLNGERLSLEEIQAAAAKQKSVIGRLETRVSDWRNRETLAIGLWGKQLSQSFRSYVQAHRQPRTYVAKPKRTIPALWREKDARSTLRSMAWIGGIGLLGALTAYSTFFGGDIGITSGILAAGTLPSFPGRFTTTPVDTTTLYGLEKMFTRAHNPKKLQNPSDWIPALHAVGVKIGWTPEETQPTQKVINDAIHSGNPEAYIKQLLDRKAQDAALKGIIPAAKENSERQTAQQILWDLVSQHLRDLQKQNRVPHELWQGAYWPAFFERNGAFLGKDGKFSFTPEYFALNDTLIKILNQSRGVQPGKFHPTYVEQLDAHTFFPKVLQRIADLPEVKGTTNKSTAMTSVAFLVGLGLTAATAWIGYNEMWSQLLGGTGALMAMAPIFGAPGKDPFAGALTFEQIIQAAAPPLRSRIPVIRSRMFQDIDNTITNLKSSAPELHADVMTYQQQVLAFTDVEIRDAFNAIAEARRSVYYVGQNDISSFEEWLRSPFHIVNTINFLAQYLAQHPVSQQQLIDAKAQYVKEAILVREVFQRVERKNRASSMDGGKDGSTQSSFFALSLLGLGAAHYFQQPIFYVTLVAGIAIYSSRVMLQWRRDVFRGLPPFVWQEELSDLRSYLTVALQESSDLASYRAKLKIMKGSALEKEFNRLFPGTSLSTWLEQPFQIQKVVSGLLVSSEFNLTQWQKAALANEIFTRWKDAAPAVESSSEKSVTDRTLASFTTPPTRAGRSTVGLLTSAAIHVLLISLMMLPFLTPKSTAQPKPEPVVIVHQQKPAPMVYTIASPEDLRAMLAAPSKSTAKSADAPQSVGVKAAPAGKPAAASVRAPLAAKSTVGTGTLPKSAMPNTRTFALPEGETGIPAAALAFNALPGQKGSIDQLPAGTSHMPGHGSGTGQLNSRGIASAVAATPRIPSRISGGHSPINWKNLYSYEEFTPADEKRIHDAVQEFLKQVDETGVFTRTHVVSHPKKQRGLHMVAGVFWPDPLQPGTLDWNRWVFEEKSFEAGYEEIGLLHEIAHQKTLTPLREQIVATLLEQGTFDDVDNAKGFLQNYLHLREELDAINSSLKRYQAYRNSLVDPNALPDATQNNDLTKELRRQFEYYRGNAEGSLLRLSKSQRARALALLPPIPEFGDEPAIPAWVALPGQVKSNSQMAGISNSSKEKSKKNGLPNEFAPRSQYSPSGKATGKNKLAHPDTMAKGHVEAAKRRAQLQKLFAGRNWDDVDNTVLLDDVKNRRELEYRLLLAPQSLHIIINSEGIERVLSDAEAEALWIQEFYAPRVEAAQFTTDKGARQFALSHPNGDPRTLELGAINIHQAYIQAMEKAQGRLSQNRRAWRANVRTHIKHNQAHRFDDNALTQGDSIKTSEQLREAMEKFARIYGYHPDLRKKPDYQKVMDILRGQPLAGAEDPDATVTMPRPTPYFGQDVQLYSGDNARRGLLALRDKLAIQGKLPVSLNALAGYPGNKGATLRLVEDILKGLDTEYFVVRQPGPYQQLEVVYVESENKPDPTPKRRLTEKLSDLPPMRILSRDAVEDYLQTSGLFAVYKAVPEDITAVAGNFVPRKTILELLDSGSIYGIETSQGIFFARRLYGSLNNAPIKRTLYLGDVPLHFEVDGSLLHVAFDEMREPMTLSLKDDAVISIGRDDANTIQIRNRKVSGRHLELSYIKGQLFFQNLSKTSRTYDEKLTRVEEGLLSLQVLPLKAALRAVQNIVTNTPRAEIDVYRNPLINGPLSTIEHLSPEEVIRGLEEGRIYAVKTSEKPTHFVRTLKTTTPAIIEHSDSESNLALEALPEDPLRKLWEFIRQNGYNTYGRTNDFSPVYLVGDESTMKIRGANTTHADVYNGLIFMAKGEYLRLQRKGQKFLAARIARMSYTIAHWRREVRNFHILTPAQWQDYVQKNLTHVMELEKDAESIGLNVERVIANEPYLPNEVLEDDATVLGPGAPFNQATAPRYMRVLSAGALLATPMGFDLLHFLQDHQLDWPLMIGAVLITAFFTHRNRKAQRLADAAKLVAPAAQSVRGAAEPPVADHTNLDQVAPGLSKTPELAHTTKRLLNPRARAILSAA